MNFIDTKEYSLTSYEENLMTLNRFIDESSICKYILKIKDEEERKDSREYHKELSLLLRTLFYNSRNYSPFTGLINHYSYVLDDDSYIYESDRKIEFYSLTGISFQSWELLLDTIQHNEINHYILQPEGDGWIQSPVNFDNLDNDSKLARVKKDIMYGKLSQLIMNEMNGLEKEKLNYYMTTDPEGKSVIHY
jgi:hypothetical protein